MEENYIKPIGETLQDKINWLQKELFEEKEKNKELEEELKKEKEKNKEYKDMIIRHKNQLKQSGIYGYDFDLEILKEE